jgi:amino acid transporter
MAVQRKREGLKRGLTLRDAALIGIGGAIGSGILFAAAGGTAYAGPAVLISWIVAAAMIAFITIPYAEIASMVPKGGISARIGYYVYGSYGGFISGWALFLWSAIIPAIEGVAVSQYASYWVPSLYHVVSGVGLLTPLGVIVAIIITIFFAILNFMGISKFGAFNCWLTYLKIASVILFILLVPLFLFHASNFTSTGFLPFGWAGVLIAIPATGILFSFGGYRQVADMSGEMKNPRKNVPLAIGTTLVVQSVLYILMAIVIVGAVSWAGLGVAPGTWSSVASLSSPLADLMHMGAATVPAFAGSVLGILVILALLFAIFSPFGTFGVYLTGSARIIFGFSKENALPKTFGKLNKDGVPVAALVLASVLAVLFIIPLPSWYSLVDFVVVAAVINFALIAASLPTLRKIYPGIKRPFKTPYVRAWSLLAFVMSALLIYWATYPTTLYALGATLAGTVFYLYQANNSKWKGINLRHSIWIPTFIIGMIILSYIGGGQTGGTGVIPFPYDMVLIVIYAIVFWYISQATAPKKQIYSSEQLLAEESMTSS